MTTAETDRNVEPLLLIRDDGAVRTLMMNRPTAFNALNLDLKRLFLDALTAAAADPGVRAVVITGTGRAFCSGQDLKEHLALVSADDPQVGTTVKDFYNPMIGTITALGKPVIAAVNGVVAGAGAGMATACDLRIAARSAVFRTSFAAAGLSADSGLSFNLPRLVGVGRAMQMLLLDEPVTAEQALAIGLVDQVVDDADLPAAAAELAARLAAGPTQAYAQIKASVRHGTQNTLASTLEFEGRAQVACFASPDHREALQAFVDKRPAKFTGR